MKMILADGSEKVICKGDEHFGAFLMSYGSLGIVTEVTFETVPMEILTCMKISTTFEYLLKNFGNMNKRSKYVKAWWFPEDNKALIWDVNKASEEERSQYEMNGKKLTEISKIANNKLNDTVDEMIIKMSHETCDETLEGRQFETVLRFKDVKNCVGDIY